MTDVSKLKALGTLSPGAAGTLARFINSVEHGGTHMIDRLREMGFAEGVSVELLHQSLFGKDPIAVRVGAMTVALRRREANLIEIQLT